MRRVNTVTRAEVLPIKAKKVVRKLGDWQARAMGIFRKSETYVYPAETESLLMKSINMVTINSAHKVGPDLVEVVEQAKGYFPVEVWDEIRCIGELTLERDFDISLADQTPGALLFEKLIDRIGKIIKEKGLENLLLGVTSDPIVCMNYFFDKQAFKRTVYLVHDYVNARLGVVSLFSVDDEASSKVVAHGLGHSKGLHHHEEPADIMHPALLKLPSLQVNGFCEACLRDLKESSNLQPS